MKDLLVLSSVYGMWIILMKLFISLLRGIFLQFFILLKYGFFLFLLLLYVWLDDNHTETHLILHSSQTPSYKRKITVSMVTYSSMQRSDCM